MELTFSERESVAVDDVRPTKAKPVKTTHFAWSDSPRTKHFIQAACGAWIRQRDDTPDPTCRECRIIRQAHNDLDIG